MNPNVEVDFHFSRAEIVSYAEYALIIRDGLVSYCAKIGSIALLISQNQKFLFSSVLFFITKYAGVRGCRRVWGMSRNVVIYSKEKHQVILLDRWLFETAYRSFSGSIG